MANKAVDVIIIGSGIAGLMTAHLLADHMNVMIITKSSLPISNSSCAQGGMAAALSPDDHWGKHMSDTIKAGQNHHNVESVEMLVKRAPAIVQFLEQLGVPFDKAEDGSIVLGMEGAHQKRRIVHVNGDQTGQAFTTALINAVLHRVEIREHTMITNLLSKKDRVIGVQTETECIYAKSTVLATGGIGQVYEHTSNVVESTGDGLALAYRAGATLSDLEFVQFHPTLLKVNSVTCGLISEAVRGEGATLIDERGNRIMNDYQQKELESRDIVSREIHRCIQTGKDVFLDCRGIHDFNRRFPGLSKRCQQQGINPLETPLSVVPGAHFISGGVETDCFGRTSLKGLYAVGEVACTGVHGANRLASNSLLEGLVFAEEVAKQITAIQPKTHFIYLEQDDELPDAPIYLQMPNKKEIQAKMTRLVGIERSLNGLMEMKRWLEPFLSFANKVQASDSRNDVECKNMIVVAALITEAALLRTESRGGHYRLDYRKRDDQNWLGRSISITKEHGFVVNERRKIVSPLFIETM
ncbi:L-aspartate oxidase [Alkalihalobacillus sp. MEB130]|uniref:L-aspartate oxidase n=1 Tax=Alkalihalobacillus sp. MEB130 TaxID=2976704 RepID=UPI0028DE7E74|nr:L-aspartate oxidase [Alkalihalobacillus sp. MEB130]MDT8861986.1 L-aspartate oxidase [Alkalihalobacillus sp. MEB130]